MLRVYAICLLVLSICASVSSKGPHFRQIQSFDNNGDASRGGTFKMSQARVHGGGLPRSNAKPKASDAWFASYYGDHMVLQRSPSKANVWGFAVPALVGKTLTLSLSAGDHKTTYSATVKKGVNGTGVWSVLVGGAAGGPYNLSLDGYRTLTDVLFGDVWLCSGQSNMQFTVPQMFNASVEEKDADSLPNVRLFTAAMVTSETPLADLKGVTQQWSVASHNSVAGGNWAYFSAVCWVYGSRLQQELGVPIGLIATTWGGTPIEAWSSPEALKTCNINANTPLPRPDPSAVRFLQEEFGQAAAPPRTHSVLWNAMIHPFLNLTITGAIWYQGEANAGAPDTYKCMFPAMISDWRRRWREASHQQTDDTFPFGFVQLGPYEVRSKGKDIIRGYADIRWHQTADMGSVPNGLMPKVFMAAAVDLTDDTSPYGSVHIRDKLTVGSRLALSGLAVAYGRSDLHFQGPQISAFYIDIGYFTLGLEFDSRKHPITVRSKDGFEVCCTHDNTTYCGEDSDTWTPVPITQWDASMVTLYYGDRCANTWIMGVRYIWRETPCAYKACAVYSVENDLPLTPFVESGIIGGMARGARN